MTFLFYDLETTGTDPVFDQVCQFAAIRTDHSLNEIERFERFIRLRPDVIPSAAALVKTRRSISDTLPESNVRCK
jgi:exodeoxyribonuclease-1